MTPAEHYATAELYLADLKSGGLEPQEEEFVLCLAGLHTQLALVGATMLSTGTAATFYGNAHSDLMDQMKAGR